MGKSLAGIVLCAVSLYAQSGPTPQQSAIANMLLSGQYREIRSTDEVALYQSAVARKEYQAPAPVVVDLSIYHALGKPPVYVRHFRLPLLDKILKGAKIFGRIEQTPGLYTKTSIAISKVF